MAYAWSQAPTGVTTQQLQQRGPQGISREAFDTWYSRVYGSSSSAAQRDNAWRQMQSDPGRYSQQINQLKAFEGDLAKEKALGVSRPLFDAYIKQSGRSMNGTAQNRLWQQILANPQAMAKDLEQIKAFDASQKAAAQRASAQQAAAPQGASTGGSGVAATGGTATGGTATDTAAAGTAAAGTAAAGSAPGAGTAAAAGGSGAASEIERYQKQFDDINQKYQQTLAESGQAKEKLGLYQGGLELLGQRYVNDIDAYNKKLSAYESDISSYRNQLDSYSRQFQDQNSQLASYRSQVNDYESRISGYKSNLDSYRSQLDSTSRQYQEALNQGNTYRSSLADLQSRFTALSTERDQYKSETDRYREQAVGAQLSNLRSGFSQSSAPSAGGGDSDLRSGRRAGLSQGGGALVDVRSRMDATDSVLNRKRPVVEVIAPRGQGQAPASARAATTAGSVASGASGYYARRFG